MALGERFNEVSIEMSEFLSKHSQASQAGDESGLTARLNVLSGQACHIIRWFESLSPESLEGIGSVYGQGAIFRDPFNEVQGVAAIRKVYAHMFESLNEPKFEVTEAVEQGDRLCVVWIFRFFWRDKPVAFEGTTWFVLDAEGLITSHRDYWDVAHCVYERIPLIGTVLRMLRKRMSTPA